MLHRYLFPLIVLIAGCEKDSLTKSNAPPVESTDSTLTSTSVEVIKIRHSEQFANAIVFGLGITDLNTIDDIYEQIEELQVLFAESEDFNLLTGGYINALYQLSEVACEGFIYRQERGLLEIDRDESTLTDQRQIYKGIWLEVDEPNSFEQNWIQSQNHSTSSDFSNYRNAIKRLARRLWGRDSSKTEEDRLLTLVQSLHASSTEAKGYRSAVAICISMLTSADFLRQ